MYFKHPELLYALFLLLIPILIHLFQLRKFQKEDFTNVKFLEKVSRQTRKSSRLKKWLVLIIRMLLLACLIFAFTQPFFPASEKAMERSQKIFYLDNSLSMQATGKQGELLPAAVQNLLEELPEDEEFSLITNDNEFLNVTLDEIKNELQNIDYTHQNTDFKNLQIKADQIFKHEDAENKDLIIISDFQQDFEFSQEPEGQINYHLVPLQPKNNLNFNLDTAFVENRDSENINLSIRLSSNIVNEEQVPVSIFNAEELLAKTSINFEGETTAETTLKLENEPVSEGKIEIEDNSLQYDNSLYFSFNENPEINVVVISEADAGFLERIFTQPEFSFKSYRPGETDYSQLSSAHLVIVNEISEITPALSNILEQLENQGARLVIIPPENGKISTYNVLLNSFGAPDFGKKLEQERLVTNISFSHPLFNAVFEEEVQNFEYPKVLSFYSFSPVNTPILSFQDNNAFLVQQEQVFIFTAPLNSNNSNFKNSPLVVPSFYNIGLKALKTSEIYYEIGVNNQIDIPVNTGKDEVVKLVSNSDSFIPLQQSFPNKVEIITGELPDKAGNYSLMYKDKEQGKLSFNFPRQESKLIYSDLSHLENLQSNTSLKQYFDTAKATTQIHALWKWFVIFALFFLIVEMLLLKYLK